MSTKTITVIQSSDAKKIQIDLDLSATTLNDLKNQLSLRDVRIFHLGRELKSGGRSLERLGVGKFRNYMLHAAPAKKSATLNHIDVSQQQQQVLLQQQIKRVAQVVDLLDDDSDDDEVLIVEAPTKRQRV